MDAVIFDLDGTILDSEPWHKRAEIETFAALGIPIGEADLLPYTGTTLPYMLAGLAPGISVEEFLAIERPILTRFIHESMRVFPDAMALIDRLQTNLAIATSSMKWYLEESTRRFSVLAEGFDVRVCQADVREGKPHPEIFLLASQLLGVAPEACWVIEDSRNGVVGAKAAGCHVVGVQRHPLIDLSDADRVVASLDELDQRTFKLTG